MPGKKVSTFNTDGTNQRSTMVVGTAYRGTDGELYVTDGDQTVGALNVAIVSGTVSAGPVQYTRNATSTLVTRDTATAANNRPLPVELLAGDAQGPVTVGVGASNTQTLRVHVGNSEVSVNVANATLSVLLGDSVGNGLNSTDVGGKRSLDVNVTAMPAGGSTSTLQTTGNTSLASIDTKTPALEAGKVPVVSNVRDGSGNAVTSTVTAGARGLDVNVVGNTAISMYGVITADEGTVTLLGTAGYGSIGVVVSGTWNGSLVVEGSIDGTNWFTKQIIPAAGGARVNNLNSNGSYFTVGASNDRVRVRADTFVSGTAAVFIDAAGPSNVVRVFNTAAANLATTVGNLPTIVDTNAGASGASTLRVSANLMNNGAALTYGAGTISSATLRVAAGLLQDGSVVNSSNPLAMSLENVAGAALSRTNPLPIAAAGTAAVQITSATVRPYLQNFLSSSLTTAYTQMTAATTAQINSFSATNNSSEPIYIATGAAASEVVQYIVSPGEVTGQISLQIASGARLSIRAAVNTVTSGTFVFNAFQ